MACQITSNPTVWYTFVQWDIEGSIEVQRYWPFVRRIGGFPWQKGSEAVNVSMPWRKGVCRGSLTQRGKKLRSQKNYPSCSCFVTVTSYEQFGFSNHRQLECLSNNLFRSTYKKHIKAPRHWPFVRVNHQNIHYSVTHMGVSNHRQLNCLCNNSFRLTSKKTPNPAIPVLCVGNPPVDSPPKGPVTEKRCHALTSPWLNIWKPKAYLIGDSVCGARDVYLTTEQLFGLVVLIRNLIRHAPWCEIRGYILDERFN